MKRTLLVALLAFPALFAVACGGTSSQTMMAACQDDPRASTFVPGLKKMGKDGLYQAELSAADPAPPDRGDNAWTLRLTDAAGQPVIGAALTAEPYMPDHGHGSTPKFGTVTDQGDGSYRISSLNLFMAGYWQVTLTVQSGDQSDQIVYGFCIEG